MDQQVTAGVLTDSEIVGELAAGREVDIVEVVCWEDRVRG